MDDEQKFNELIKLKKQTLEKLSVTTEELKTIESKIETLKSEISQIDTEIGIMRGVDMSDCLINETHTTGGRLYYCDGSICIVKHCDKGREISYIALSYQDEICLGPGCGSVYGIKHPTIIYYVDGEEDVIKNTDVSIKRGCDERQITRNDRFLHTYHFHFSLFLSFT